MSDTTQEKKPLYGLINGVPLSIPVIGLCGAKGAGKTIAALTICPEETIEIGIEDSGVTYNLPLKHRFSMYDEVKAKGSVPTPIECFEWFHGIIDQIASGKLSCRVLAIDPITDIQTGLVDWVEANAAKFGKTPTQYEKASGLLWGDVKSYMKLLLGKISRKVETVVFTSHMGTVWSGGAPVAGKTKAKGIDTFYEIASLYVYLTRDVDKLTGRQAAAPAGSITLPHGKSRLARFEMNKAGVLEPHPILPPRIDPFTWTKIREYVATPPNYDKLKKNELAQPEVLTADDKLMIESQMAADVLRAAEIKSDLSSKAQEAARRNAEIAAVKANAKPSLPATPAKTEVAEKITESPAAASTTTVKVDDAGQSVTVTTESEKDGVAVNFGTFDRTLWMDAIREQMTALGMTIEQKKAAVSKRGGAKLLDLTDDVLDELRRKLWSKLTAREMEKKTTAKK